MFARALLVLAVVGFVVADEPKDDTSTKVSGKLIFAKDLPAFAGKTVELLLFEYDPRIADKAATQIDKLEIKDVKHAGTAETVKEFSLGAKGKIGAGKSYYLTAFVLDGKTRTHIGQCDHVKEPFNKVLTGGNPRVVVVRFRAVK